MICEKCGAELKHDQVFCPECGSEMQLVANYNPTEEEILGLDMDLVAPDISSLEDDISNGADKKKGLSPMARRLIPVISCILVLAVIGIAVYHYLKNDYNHQFEAASTAFDKSDFKAAIEHAKAASDIDKKSVDSRWLLARAYVGSGDPDGALTVIEDILALTSNNASDYDTGMSLFIDAKEYKTAAALLDTTTDVKIREKFAMYLACTPKASIESGDLNFEPSIELTAEGKSKIYFTIDKEDASKGSVYSEAVKIPAGKHILRAVSLNQYGVLSAEAQYTYSVTPGIPDMPEILPAGVNIPLGTEISIKVPEDCHVYYTWDGSEPTIYSTEYKEPFQAPEGNNILSVVVVDKYGQSSNVAKKNYIVN